MDLEQVVNLIRLQVKKTRLVGSKKRVNPAELIAGIGLEVEVAVGEEQAAVDAAVGDFAIGLEEVFASCLLAEESWNAFPGVTRREHLQAEQEMGAKVVENG